MIRNLGFGMQCTAYAWSWSAFDADNEKTPDDDRLRVNLVNFVTSD